MVCFLKKIILFLLPVGFIFIFPVLILVLGKEHVSIQYVVETQINYPEALFSFAYNSESFIPYKKLLIDSKKPKIVSLGTSRVMQIREEFFKEPWVFVNAGGAGKTLEDMRLFIEELPVDSQVKILILSLDQDMFFNSPFSFEKRTEEILPVRFTKIISSMTRRIYLDYIAHKYSINSLFVGRNKDTKNIGLSALIYEDGFRSDGSYRYNQAFHNLNRVQEVTAQIKQKTEEIKKDSREVNDYQRQQLELNLTLLSEILERSKQKDIVIIGFLPPYPQLTYQTMLDTNGFNNELVTTIPLEVEDIFSAHNYSFFDFSSPEVFGGNETEFVDVIHGTDVMYLKMMMYLVEYVEELDGYIDKDSLKEMLKNRDQDFLSL